MNKKLLTYSIVMALTILSLQKIGLAHGIDGYITHTKTPVTIQFLYSTGEKAPYANIIVYSPEDAHIEYQNARTDKSGFFSFVPNHQGIWTVVMSDTMGHKTRVEIPINDAFLHTNQTDSNEQKCCVTPTKCPFAQIAQAPIWIRSILGISVIINIFLGIFLIYIRKNTNAHK